jgi:cellulose synthase/poly-beta-1,6-N-acetylglucosamine synthase-like glycosyltransferase
MSVAEFVLLAPAAFFALIAIYLLIITAAAFVYRAPTAKDAAEPAMAVIMPAHNEAGQIAVTVKSVLDCVYPENRRQVFVIADNCDDGTAEVARAAGAVVFERHDDAHRGKGQALDWCLQQQSAAFRDADLLVLFDADVTIAPDCLREIAAVFANPRVAVVQCYYGVANPLQNWRTALTYAGFCLMNHVRPAGRSCLGGSAGLKGTGMAFRRDVLLHYGWPAHSIVEDIEFGTLLLVDGIRVVYAPRARHVSEMPATRAQAASQRRRWESGRMQVVGSYVPALLGRFLRTGRARFLDAALDLAVPPLSLLVMGQVFLLVLCAAMRSPLALLFAATIAATVAHVLGGLIYSRAPGRVYLYLLCVPFFLLWKLPLYAKMLVSRPEKTWVRTARSGEDQE